MMKLLFTFFAALLFCVDGYAQVLTGVVTHGNSTAFLPTNGLMFNDYGNGMAGYEAPYFSGVHSIYAHSFILAGITQEGEVRSHYQRYCNNNETEACQGVYGPLKQGAPKNSEDEVSQYNWFWRIYSSDLDYHLGYFECLNDPDCDELEEYSGFSIPTSIETWPAHGNTDLGFASNLAPFVDVDGDNLYNAANGDYPNICGDRASYFIYNDVGTENSEYAQTPMGVEIHTQTYSYAVTDQAGLNTVFIRHKIINRSDEDYSDVYMGNFTDFDLGNPFDDRIATDVARGMYYVYNGDDFDEPTEWTSGYYENIAAQGIRYLGGAFVPADGMDNEHDFDGYDSYANYASGWGDGIADNERQGLSSLMLVNLDLNPISADPVTPAEHYNFLSGKWNNGMQLTYGATGEASDGIPARYFFSGSSDPYFAGTFGVDPEYGEDGWTEESENLEMGDRKVIAATGPFDLPAGSVQYLDYAVIFAQESQSADENVVETLLSYADEIVGMECSIQPDVVTGVDDVAKELEFTMFPNPSSDEVTVQLGESYGQTRVEVLDLSSRVIQQAVFTNTHQMTISLDMAAGQYLLRISTDDRVGVKKLTKF